MQNHQSAKPVTVPQRVYEWYNSHFCNSSYRAFRDALTESAHYGQLSATQSNDEFIGDTMNLLIDASFERSGAEHHHGAEAQLMQQIAHLDSRLVTLARIHLMNFNGSAKEEAEQALLDARLLAETAVQKASDIHSWRGRVAYAWASAAMFLLHAAFAVLIENVNDLYTLEKVDRALDHLRNGIIEAKQNGFTLSERAQNEVRNNDHKS